MPQPITLRNEMAIIIHFIQANHLLVEPLNGIGIKTEFNLTGFDCRINKKPPAKTYLKKTIEGSDNPVFFFCAKNAVRYYGLGRFILFNFKRYFSA